ncbi:MAG TPA: heme-binding protein [Gammaproteobacteria bacterium]|nr:heme-binding protein [Gammaproteobacteria bacterium]
MKAKNRRLLPILCVLLIAGQGMAAELPTRPVLPLAMAVQAAEAALEQCRRNGYQVSAAVVDEDGVLLALLRADGAGVHTVDSSRRKAYTAASMKAPTARFADLIARLPQVQGLRDMNDSILMLGGGLPIRMDGQVVGGIGVGGAPGAQLDEDCARAGLRRIGADASLPKPRPDG